MAKIRVMLVDDHALFRQGLRTLLESREEFEVIAEAVDGQEAVGKAGELRPDVVLMDISLPGMDGLAATRLIRSQFPQIKVLMVTMHGGDEYFFRALEAGASGYVTKEAAFSNVLAAIQSVHQGQMFISSSLTRRLVEEYLVRVSTGVQRESYARLTEREREVVGLVAAGKTNREIADELSISISTVQTHCAHVMEKLNLNSRNELMNYGLRLGLVRPPASPLY
jgi:two-component system, NarL family, response regulator NreC